MILWDGLLMTSGGDGGVPEVGDDEDGSGAVFAMRLC